MIARNYIDTNLPTINCNDAGNKVLDIMENFKVAHLPIVEEGDYIGLISDTVIYDLNLDSCCLDDREVALADKFVFENRHVFEVIQMARQFDLSVVPVLKADRNYLGAIKISHLQEKLCDYFSVNDLGAVLVLEVAINDYSLSQISQLVESNDIKIMSLYTFHNVDSNKLEVTLKLNASDISSVIETFVRYEYSIVGVFMDDSKLNDVYHSRYEQFMKYLSI